MPATTVYLFHLFVVVPLLLLVGVTGLRGRLLPAAAYALILLLGLGALGYHSWKLVKR